jgi:hypothetical protein
VTFTDVATLSADTNPHLTGDKLFFVDLTSFRAPYMRFVFNDGSLAAGTTGRFTFIVVGMIPGSIHNFVGV